MYNTQYEILTSSGYMYRTQYVRNSYVIRRWSGEVFFPVLQFSLRLPLRRTEDGHGNPDLSTVTRLGWHYYTIMFVSICWWWTRRRCGKRRKNSKFEYIFVWKVFVNSCLNWNKDFCFKKFCKIFKTKNKQQKDLNKNEVKKDQWIKK